LPPILAAIIQFRLSPRLYKVPIYCSRVREVACRVGDEKEICVP
jgi:hypothetical protein